MEVLSEAIRRRLQRANSTLGDWVRSLKSPVGMKVLFGVYVPEIQGLIVGANIANKDLEPETFYAWTTGQEVSRGPMYPEPPPLEVASLASAWCPPDPRLEGRALKTVALFYPDRHGDVGVWYTRDSAIRVFGENMVVETLSHGALADDFRIVRPEDFVNESAYLSL